MKLGLLVSAALIPHATPALAQPHQGHGDHQAAGPHAGHQAPQAQEKAEPADPHAGHDMRTMPDHDMKDM